MLPYEGEERRSGLGVDSRLKQIEADLTFIKKAGGIAALFVFAFVGYFTWTTTNLILLEDGFPRVRSQVEEIIPALSEMKYTLRSLQNEVSLLRDELRREREKP